MNNDLHAVFATRADDSATYRVSDPLSWDSAQAEWKRLDDLHRKGLLPQAKFFEVRSVTLGPDRPLVGPEVSSHGRYDKAPVNLNMARPVTGKRGYGKLEDAARKAWKMFAPTYTPRNRWNQGVQGLGGWYFWPNGRSAAQGLSGLGRLVVGRQMVVQSGGRWFVYDTKED